MYDERISLIFAAFIAVCCSHKIVYFDTPFYGCKEQCCTSDDCLSFYIVLSSLECYMNDEDNHSAGEIAPSDKDAHLNGRHNEVVKALHGSCKSWRKTSDGCMDGLRFKWIRMTFGKTYAKQENSVKLVATTVGYAPSTIRSKGRSCQSTSLDHGSTASPGGKNGYAPNTMISELVCPSSFILDAHTASCWKINSSLVFRRNAEKNCARLGGRLAVLDTSAKHLSVKKLLSTSSHKFCVHIGGRRKKFVGFMWLTNVEVGKQGWCPNEPSGNYVERLLSLYPEMGYCFDDLKDNEKCPYICEVRALINES